MIKSRHILRSAAAFAAAAALVPAAVAGAQDPGPPPNPDAAPLDATLSFPSSATTAQLKKGLAAKVGCDLACNARLSFAGPVGIVTTKSGDVAAGGTKTFRIKPIAMYLKAMKKGQTYTLSLQARTPDGALEHVSKKLKIK